MAITADLQKRVETTADQPSATERLAELVVRTRAADLSDDLLEATTGFVLDWLGCSIAGLPANPGQALLKLTARQPRGDVSVLGFADGRSARDAAFHNGAMSHITEMDDVDHGSVTHPGAVVIPAALAVAEQRQATGRDFLAAVALGYEVMIRVGESVGKTHYVHHHNTATCGVFGAAAAAGWLLGLSREQLVWALGSAGTQAAGLWQFLQDGTMSKQLHTGGSASDGVLAAELAECGFTGAREILDGSQGFWAAMAPDAIPEAITRGLGQRNWKLPGVSIKPYPSCRHTHSAVDAALRLRHQLGRIEASDIAAVEVWGYHSVLDLCNNPNPNNQYSAKFSIHYTVARALLDGHLRLNDFTDEQMSEPRVREVMARTTVRLDDRLDSLYPAQFPARVALTLSDGRSLSEEVLSPKGDPENALSREELEQKFLGMLDGTPYAGREQRYLTEIRELAERGSMRGFLAL